MMNLSRQNRHTRTPNRAVVAVTLLVIVLGSVDFFSGGGVRSVVRSGTGAVLASAGSAIGAVYEADVLQNRRALLSENIMLKDQVARLQALETQNEVIKAENRALKGLLSIEAEDEQRGVGARVLSWVDASPYGTLLVGVGSESGVSIGDLVVAPGDIAIAEIIEVSAGVSLAALFTQHGKETEVLMGDARAQFVGQSSGNGAIVLPRDIEVTIGDLVLLPASGFAIGEVGHIDVSPADAQQRILVRVPTNLRSLQLVRVVAASRAQSEL